MAQRAIDRMQRIESQLLQQLDAFVAFARRRVQDPALAADAVQESLLKAIKSADQLRDDESVTAWFYRILRRTIIDLYRRRDVTQRAMQRLEAEHEKRSEPDFRVACECLESLIPALKPEYGELIRALDLEGQPPGEIAARRKLTLNNLRVRHHRARQQLRQRLEETCRLCARHGCLDCTCADESTVNERHA
jgi:RNA polymerase sigma factor (sigma-70 family)